jgi:hypothetical protein
VESEAAGRQPGQSQGGGAESVRAITGWLDGVSLRQRPTSVNRQGPATASPTTVTWRGERRRSVGVIVRRAGREK